MKLRIMEYSCPLSDTKNYRIQRLRRFLFWTYWDTLIPSNTRRNHNDGVFHNYDSAYSFYHTLITNGTDTVKRVLREDDTSNNKGQSSRSEESPSYPEE